MSNVSTYTIGAILSLQTLCTCIIATIGQYIYAYYLSIYPIPQNNTSNLTNIIDPFFISHLIKDFHDNNKNCKEGDISQHDDALTWAQERSANLTFWTNLYGSCPVIIMTYILGLYITKLGKPFVLLLTMIGILGQFIIWLAIIYFHLPEYWWYIASVVLGLSGGSTVLNFVLNLIITDNTIESDLSSRFVRLVAVQTGLSAIATFAIGYYIEWRGFTDLYWIGLGLDIFSIFIVIYCFKSLNSNINERIPLITSENFSNNNCSHFFQICTVFHLNRRTSKKSACLVLTLCSNIFYTLASSTFAPFLWFLLDVPFCWTSTSIGNYSALTAISAAILSIIGMQILTIIGASDAIICMISHLFFFTSSIWLVYARHSWELYAGLIVSAFSGYQGTLTISMMTKWLEPYERSNAFTFLTVLNTITLTFGSTLFTWVYARTVGYYKNLTLLIGAGLCFIPFTLNLCIFLITRKMSDEELPLLSETNVEPAPLRLPNNGPPHAGDASCIIIPSRSLTSSLRVQIDDESSTNITDNSEIEDTSNIIINDLITF